MSTILSSDEIDRFIAHLIAEDAAERDITTESVVIATGGGIVTNDAAFEALLARTHTMWIQATPQEHMSRVVEQGDLRPMADNREAMRDLRQILSARESAYSRALATFDTSGQTIAESSDKVLRLARGVMKDELAAH